MSCNVAAGEPSGKELCKFQLGKTLTVIPARLIRRVWKANFVDLAELTDERLELELRRAGEKDEAKPPRSKLPPIPDLLAWTRAFMSLCWGGGRGPPRQSQRFDGLYGYDAL